MNKFKSAFVIALMVGAMAFAVWVPTSGQIKVTYASNPVVKMQKANTTSTVNHFSWLYSVMTTGDDFVVAASFFLKGGTQGAGLTLTTIPSMISTCQQLLVNANVTHGQMAQAWKCVAEVAGSYNFTLTSTSNTCGGASPCGLFAEYIYEFGGSGYRYAATDGHGNALFPTTHSHNSLVSNATSFGILIGTMDETNQPTLQGGYTTFGCPIYSTGPNTFFSCSGYQNFVSTGTTNFPYNMSGVGFGSSGISEGVMVYCTSLTTTTSGQTTVTLTATTVSFTDLGVDYSNLWVIFLIFAVLASSAITFFIVARKTAKGE